MSLGSRLGIGFMRAIAPLLRSAGLSEAEIDDLVTHNPRRYFGG